MKEKLKIHIHILVFLSNSIQLGKLLNPCSIKEDALEKTTLYSTIPKKEDKETCTETVILPTLKNCPNFYPPKFSMPKISRRQKSCTLSSYGGADLLKRSKMESLGNITLKNAFQIDAVNPEGFYPGKLISSRPRLQSNCSKKVKKTLTEIKSQIISPRNKKEKYIAITQNTKIPNNCKYLLNDMIPFIELKENTESKRKISNLQSFLMKRHKLMMRNKSFITYKGKYKMKNKSRMKNNINISKY